MVAGFSELKKFISFTPTDSRNCLNLYCEIVYSVFLSETTTWFAAIVELTTERNTEEVVAKKTHKQIIR